jgi:Multiubiquitin
MPDVNPAVDQQVQDGHVAELFKLKIDRDPFDWNQPTISGQQLRDLPKTPIGDDRDVYEEVPGGEDRLIGPTSVVTLKAHGESRFFTAPHHVTPGA